MIYFSYRKEVTLMGKTIYFDMDGTIADLYGVENWEPQLRAENPAPYYNAKPMIDTVMFTFYCSMLLKAGYNLGVISWLSKNSSKSYEEAVTTAKKEWLVEFAPALLLGETHFISYGTPKHTVAKDKTGILIDDSEPVGQEWQKQGGVWINVNEITTTEYIKAIAG